MCLGINNKDKICSLCNNLCFIKCDTCKEGKLKWFQSLRIIWKNNIDLYTTKCQIPESKLRLVYGNVIYEDCELRVRLIIFLDKCFLTKQLIIFL